MKALNKLFLYASMAAVMSACSIEANVAELFPTKAISNLLGKTQGAEFVNGSTQQQTTSGGYKVSVSVGSFVGSLQATTTNGYKVYSAVQGDMLSDSIQ